MKYVNIFINIYKIYMGLFIYTWINKQMKGSASEWRHVVLEAFNFNNG